MDIYTEFKGVITLEDVILLLTHSLSPPLRKTYLEKRFFQYCDALFNVHQSAHQNTPNHTDFICVNIVLFYKTNLL